MATIFPAVGEEKAVAQQLLNMADSARDVKIITDTAPGTGYVAFSVPDELGDRYIEAQRLAKDIDEEIQKRLAAEDEEEASVPKKRVGRPRKQQAKVEAEETADAEIEEDEEEDPKE